MSYTTTERRPKARKEHMCDWCTEPIIAGETHCYVSGIDSEGFYAWRAHTDCEEAMQRELLRSVYWEDISWGERHKRGMTLEETEDAESEVQP